MALSGLVHRGSPVPVSDRIVASSKSNFAVSFFFLPEKRKCAVKTFYAFCRVVDDGVDNAVDSRSALESTRFWREEIERIGNGRSLSPLGREIKETVDAFGLSIGNYRLVIEGVESDVTKRRYETFEELYRYCYRVASSVGFFCCEISGVTSPSAMRYAELTGIGVQLTNILRDIREDAERGRIYLPLEDLRRFNVTAEDILQARVRQNLVHLLHFEAARAEAFFKMGRMLLSPYESLKLYFCHLLAGTYMALLEELKQEDFGLFDGKVNVGASKRIRTGVKNAFVNVFGSFSA